MDPDARPRIRTRTTAVTVEAAMIDGTVTKDETATPAESFPHSSDPAKGNPDLVSTASETPLLCCRC